MNRQQELKQLLHLLYHFPGLLPVTAGIQQLQTHMLTSSCSHRSLRSGREAHFTILPVCSQITLCAFPISSAHPSGSKTHGLD